MYLKTFFIFCRWSNFEDCCETLKKWLNEVESTLPEHIVLRATLDEKKAQLQSYRSILHDTQVHQQDIGRLNEHVELLADRNETINAQLKDLISRHAKVLERAQVGHNLYVQSYCIVNFSRE